MDPLERTMLKEKEERISMSRVPSKTKALFLDIANEDYSGDYGMTLKGILDGYMMFKVYFENMDMKLDKILDELNQGDEQSSESDEIKTMSGRIVGTGGKE